MTTLIISHYLYLNREQRYLLHENKEPIEVHGISVPVWFQKGNTSEPAKEVFCKYRITNETTTKSITATNCGYLINLPQMIEFKPGKVSEPMKIILNNNQFTNTSNPTWTSGTTSFITEIGLYNQQKELMIISKLQSPTQRLGIQQFVVKLDF